MTTSSVPVLLCCCAAVCVQEWAACGSSFVQQVQQLIADPQQRLPTTLTNPAAADGQQQQQQKLWATDAGAADVTFIITLYEHVAAALIDMRVKVRAGGADGSSAAATWACDVLYRARGPLNTYLVTW
jgi:hypothetical protein